MCNDKYSKELNEVLLSSTTWTKSAPICLWGFALLSSMVHWIRIPLGLVRTRRKWLISVGVFFEWVQHPFLTTKTPTLISMKPIHDDKIEFTLCRLVWTSPKSFLNFYVPTYRVCLALPFTSSGQSGIFQWGAPTPGFGAKTYYLAYFFPKTASKCKQSDREGTRFPSQWPETLRSVLINGARTLDDSEEYDWYWYGRCINTEQKRRRRRRRKCSLIFGSWEPQI